MAASTSGSRSSGNTVTGVGSGDRATGEEKGSSEDVLDFPILEFCTQLDDYTPTVRVVLTGSRNFMCPLDS